MVLPELKTAHLQGKRVLVRLDLDVPLKNGEIEDATRIQAGLDTVQYLLQKGANVVIVGHLGRPNGKESDLSLLPVVMWFQEKLNCPTIQKTQLEEFDGWNLSDSLTILENLRFYEGEKTKDASLKQEFAKKLARLADIFVNDAFAVIHRADASIVGMPKLLPHFAGIQLQKEIQTLLQIVENPKRPFVVLVGGAKLETKLPLISKMHHKADYVLVGGKIALETRELLKLQHEEIKERKSALLVAELNEKQIDITEMSAENFAQIIKEAKSIVWNGPLGFFEKGNNEGTKRIAEAIIESSAYSVVGGGDTISCLKKLGLLSKFDFVSTGGGAMLALLSGEKLPGLEALQK